MKKLHIFALSILSVALVAIPFVAVRAEFIKGEERVYFAPDRVVDDNIIATAGDVDIQSRVLGDVIAAGGNVRISGDVEGDVIVAGGQVDISATVHGSVWVVGGTVHISGTVDQNIRAVGGNVALASGVRVGRNVAVAGGVVDIAGEIDRRVDVAGGIIKLAAIVNGDVHAFVDHDGQLVVNPPAEIAGNLSYVAVSADDVVVDPAVSVGRLDHVPMPDVRPSAGMAAAMGILALILQIFWLAVLVLFVYYAGGRFVPSLLTQLLADPVRQIGWGALVVVGAPVAVVLLMITVIGVPLGIILMLAYIIYWVMAPAVVAMAVGQWLLRRRHPENTPAITLPYLLWGVLMVTLISSLSWIGLLAHLVIVMWGIGGLAQYKWKFMRSA